jgi:hypothetical protein
MVDAEGVMFYTTYIVSGVEVKNCNATYGAIGKVVYDLNSYVNEHISRSFEYLLIVCILRYVHSCI